MIAGALAVLLAAAPAVDSRPVAEVWPYQATRLPDGRLQLSYDLSGLKTGIMDTEAASEMDEPSLQTLAKSLPKEAKVVVEAGGALHLEVASDREKAAPSVSFSVPQTPLAADTPIEKGPAARVLPALHPDSPKILFSTEAALWKVRHANESIVAGLELAADEGTLGLPMGARALWQGVLKAALERASNDSESKEGAVLLSELVGAALKRQGVAVPAAIAKNSSMNEAVEELVSKWDENPNAAATTLRSTFSAELKKLELRNRALSQPFPDSRAGKAAALTFLVILEKDAKLRAGYEALEKLRATLFGAPAEDVLATWKKLAGDQGGAQAASDNFPEFVALLQRSDAKMPALFAWSDAPIERQLNELGGAAQENALDDVVLQLEEDRLKPDNGDGAAWLSVMDWALAASVQSPEKSERPQRTRSRGQRARLAAAFVSAIPAPSTPADADGSEDRGSEDRRPYGLKVALKVPPQFTAEPTTGFYGRLAKAYERLEKFLAATGKAGSVSGVMEGGGKRGANNKAEAQKLKRIFRGLELVSSGAAAGAGEDKESVKAAETFVGAWKTDPDLAADVRFAGVLRGGGQLAVYGVGRQAITVSWESAPKATVQDSAKAPALVVDLSAAQRFIVPSLVTGTLNYPGTLPDRGAFRAISDKAARQPNAVDASLQPGSP
ncbi:MAG: hypothetical protein ACJ790_03980 [Myxococcaceae bacterium]